MPTHHLLVVEDDEATRSALVGIFSRRGWAVAGTPSVNEAVRWLKVNPEPCCIVLDLDLFDGGGEAVLAQIRALGLKTHVAVASGTDDLQRLKMVRCLAPDVLLTKPVSVDDLWNGDCRVCRSA